MNILGKLARVSILILTYYILCLSNKNERMSFNLKVSFSQIQEGYMRINVSRRIELERTLKELLQIAIFNYLLAQNKFSDMKLLGLDDDSKEFDDAILDLEEAVETLRTAKNKWDNIKSTTAGFTYRNENRIPRDTRLRWGDVYLDGLLDSNRFRGYNGDRGIDFQGSNFEDLGQVYAQPEPKKKLDKDIIEKLDLGFDYKDLPQKYVRMLEDRKNTKKMNKLKLKGGDFLESRTTRFQHLDFLDDSFSSDFNRNEKLTRRTAVKSGVIDREKKTREQNKELNSSKGNSLIDSLERIIESLGKKEISDIVEGIKMKQAERYENSAYKTKDLGNEVGSKLGGKGKMGIQNKKQNKASKDSKLQKRSRGILSREPMYPTDVALEIEKHIGGPLKYILVKESILKTNKHLSELYERYLTAVLRCLRLYEEEASFEELFICSKKQSTLMFALIQILSESNIDYTFEDNDINNISIKIKSLNDYNERASNNEESKLEGAKIDESEKILDFLIEKNIFSSKPVTKGKKLTLMKGIREKGGNYTNNIDKNLTKTITNLDMVLKKESGEDDAVSDQTKAEKTEELSEHVRFIMSRLGFTPEEYNSCKRLSKLVQELVIRETNFFHLYKEGKRPKPHLVYEYKTVLERAFLEVMLCRIGAKKK
ncbi:hypothetical protein RS030_6866 [Cryptosporidium xiaoi]|uniref:Uncharacterized protein n=1 Tax=Cryptosporidium xiaoi TaxID=659607 RepID=A0AAV9XUE7_9CRYT